MMVQLNAFAVVIVLAALNVVACERAKPLEAAGEPSHSDASVMPATVEIYVKADGTVLWSGSVVTREELTRRMKLAAASNPQPEVHFNMDRNATYGDVGAIMEEGQKLGLTKLGVLGGI